MKTTSLLLLAGLAASARGQMYVESYWESWVLKDYPDDYCAYLEEVPASPVGSLTGVNYVNIAFADYTGGFAGIETDETVAIDGINAIHDKGGKAKLAFGGALYSMSAAIQSEEDASLFAESVQTLQELYGLDGVDLDVEDGSTDSQLQIAVLRELRAKCGDGFHISYTLPCLAENTEPWLTTLTEGAQYMDAVNIMSYDYYWEGYSFDLDLAYLDAIGIPRNKVVWGLMPGHHDASNEYTSLDDAYNSTVYAIEFGLAGVMTWDINRDTDQAKGYPQGEDNLYQTGQPDATYLDLISETLNTPP